MAELKINNDKELIEVILKKSRELKVGTLDFNISNYDEETFFDEITKIAGRAYYTHLCDLLIEFNGNNKTIKVNYLKVLYDFSISHNFNNITNFLSHIIVYSFKTFAKSYKGYFNKTEIEDYFFNAFSKKEFHTTIVDNNINFALSVLNYCENECFKLEYIMSAKLLTSIDFKNNAYKTIFERLFVMNEDDLFKLYKYDYDIKLSMHQKKYNEYIIEKLDKLYTFESPIELIIELDNKTVFTGYKELLNQYIISVNELVNVLLSEESDIRTISSIEERVNMLNILGRLKDSKLYKGKLQELHRVLLHYKRKYLKSYDTTKMQSFKYNINTEVLYDSYKTSLENSLNNIYYLLRINFEQALSDAKSNGSSFAALFFVSKIDLNIEEGMYECEKNNKYNEESEFVKYYNSLEPVNNNNYKLLINYLDRMKYQTGSIIYFTFREIIDNNLIEYINKSLGSCRVSTYNAYVLCCELIIDIENIIFEKCKKYGAVFDKDSIDISLNRLFIKTNYNNNVMLTYYILYSNDGLDLRDKLMHGNIFGKNNYMIELMYIFTALVGMVNL